uniref:Uncharacterized protein n=1 Tax=Paenibacillus athensensis TaxID=1967502 RepID=A0A4Y8PX36_9BACL
MRSGIELKEKAAEAAFFLHSGRLRACRTNAGTTRGRCGVLDRTGRVRAGFFKVGALTGTLYLPGVMVQ